MPPTVTATAGNAGGDLAPAAPGLSTGNSAGNSSPTAPGATVGGSAGDRAPTGPGLSGGASGGNLAPTAPGATTAAFTLPEYQNVANETDWLLPNGSVLATLDGEPPYYNPDGAAFYFATLAGGTSIELTITFAEAVLSVSISGTLAYQATAAWDGTHPLSRDPAQVTGWNVVTNLVGFPSPRFSSRFLSLSNPAALSATAAGDLAPSTPGGSGSAAGGNLAPTAPSASKGAAAGNLSPTAPGAIS